MLFTKKPKPISGRMLLGLSEESRDTWEEVKKKIRELPISLLWLVANATGAVIAPGVTDRLWPGLENKPDAVFYVAFAVAVSLSGLCFRMSSSIENSKQHKIDMAYAGERFLHSSFQFLTGAIFKYVASMINRMELQVHSDTIQAIHFLSSALAKIDWFPVYEWPHLFSTDDVRSFVVFLFGCVAVLMYWSAVGIAYTGVKITHDVMWQRFHRT